MAREQAEHFCPWYPNADHSTPLTALSRSASRSTTMASLPPISAITRLIQIWPLLRLGGQFVDAQADVARAGERDEARLADAPPARRPPPRRCPPAGRTIAAGSPASSSTSANLAAMVGVSLDGLITTVLPATSAAVVIPTRMASGKFHGGITTPTPSGR